jgi:hypothetical protein
MRIDISIQGAQEILFSRNLTNCPLVGFLSHRENGTNARVAVRPNCSDHARVRPDQPLRSLGRVNADKIEVSSKHLSYLYRHQGATRCDARSISSAGRV